MKVTIARAGEELGEFPRDQLERFARSGRFKPTDLYWRDGMEDWLPLEDLLGAEAWKSRPIAPPPPRAAPVRNPAPIPIAPVAIKNPEPGTSGPLMSGRFLLLAVVLVAAALLGGGIYFIATRISSGPTATTPIFTEPATATASATTVEENAVKEKAIAELQQMAARLPTKPAPPLYATYYDISVKMTRQLSPRTPWNALFHGSENVIDPATQLTVTHTDFNLAIDYQDGEWIFRRYEASVSNLTTWATTEVFEDESTVAPPSLVGIMGIKMRPKEETITR